MSVRPACGVPLRRYPNCKAPYRQCLISAPRCYCILTYYPFFSMHFQVSAHSVRRLWRPLGDEGMLLPHCLRCDRQDWRTRTPLMLEP